MAWIGLCKPAATWCVCVYFVHVFMHAHICIEKPAKAQPVLPVKSDVFAVGFASGVTPTPVHFCSRELHKLGLHLKAIVCLEWCSATTTWHGSMMLLKAFYTLARISV